MASKWLVRGVQVLVAVALPLVLLTGNVQVLAHPRFVDFEYGKGGFPADTAVPAGGYPLSTAERRRLAEAAMRSIIGAEGMRVLEEARFEETGEPAFNTREIRHMRDVRWLFRSARVIFWTALGLLVGGGTLLVRLRGRQEATQPLLVSAVATLSVAGALGLYIAVSFGSFFTRFHHVFFEGETWLFRRDDTLIRLFPTDFWFDASAILAGLTVMELALVGAAAWWWGRRQHQGVR